jgi:pyruvate-formate lyase-activating enzyme
MGGTLKNRKNYKNMRHRELTERKLDVVLGNIQRLKFIVQRQEPVESYIKVLEQVQEDVEEIQSLIRREQLDPQEGFGLY